VADPTADIYAVLDKAGLNAGNIMTARQSTAKTVLEIRQNIVKLLKEYIEERESNHGQRTKIQVSQPEDESI
jgi:hypothetical protein